MVSVACIVLTLFLLHFIVNQQYMLKIISKYEARILVHDYDCMNFGALVALAVTFGILQCFVKFPDISPPVASF